MTDFQKRYLEEVGRRLHCQGFEVWPEYEGILPIEKDARRVCNVNVHGSVSYDPDYVRRNGQEDALDQVRSTAAETMTYMRQMAAAPPLLAEGLSGDYRLLAEFNYIVLAGHERDGGYGVEFVTWERIRDGTALWQGHYYDNDFGTAKQDFATRSGLVPVNTLFTNDSGWAELHPKKRFPRAGTAAGRDDHAIIFKGPFLRRDKRPLFFYCLFRRSSPGKDGKWQANS